MTAPTNPVNSTAQLLSLVRAGDLAARETLCKTYLPILSRWARGRLPHLARGMNETNDLVQTTLLRALNHLKEPVFDREGAFLAYLRRILLNAIRDEIRATSRKPIHEVMDETDIEPPGDGLAQTVGPEVWADYEKALLALTEREREAVILRMELGFSFAEVAAAIQSPSADSARMMVSRALVKMAERMA